MDATISRNKVVEDYFNAWVNYDLSLLSSLFVFNAKYEIRNKKKTYNGIDEICEYWRLNSKRQKSLSVTWKIQQILKSKFVVPFVASFYDLEEDEYQTIEGAIDFIFTEDGKIAILSEEYIKKAQKRYIDKRS